MQASNALLDELLAWLMGAEATLTAQQQQPVPDNIPIIEQLLHDHQVEHSSGRHDHRVDMTTR